MISKETKDSEAHLYANKFVAIPRCDLLPWQEVTANDFKAGMEAAEKILAPRIELLKAAIESVASSGEPKHETKEFWLQISHKECCDVIVNDTKLAREVLSKLAKLRGKP